MADDAAAPDGELSKSTAAEETTTATEPEASGTEISDTVTDGAEDSADQGEETADVSATPAKPRMSHVKLATIAGLVAVVVLAGLTGWLGFRAYKSHQADEQRKLFLEVGRQGALNLTTIDWQHADADVQRIVDSATGTFYDDFEKRAKPFAEVVKQAQSKSVGTIAEAGLESESNDGAQVLVAVTVKTSNAGAPNQPPRAWRMRIFVEKVGNDAKVSNVVFVP
jgi:Mce-associated membrane protein